MNTLRWFRLLLSLLMIFVIIGAEVLLALGPVPAFQRSGVAALSAGAAVLPAAIQAGRELSPATAKAPPPSGRLLFAPAIDADGQAETNPVQNSPAPVLDLLGEHHAIITLAAQVEPDDAKNIPIGVPVTFRLWNTSGFHFEQEVESDAWGAVAVEIPLDDVQGEYLYQAEAPGFGTTEVRRFRFDPQQFSYRVHADGAELSYRQVAGSAIFSVHSPRPLEAGRDEINLMIARRPTLDTGTESLLQPVFEAVDEAGMGLPFPTVGMQIVNTDTAQVEMQLPPGEYRIAAIVMANQSPAEYFASQPVQIAWGQTGADTSGEAVWVSDLEYEPGYNLVQYHSPQGQAHFALVDATQLPELSQEWEGQSQLVQFTRTGPFEWRQDTYDVQIETLVTDGKKVVALEDFDYDPILRRYTLAIRSQQAEVVTDTLRVDVLGPEGVVIYHEDAPVLLEPGRTLNYVAEVPADLGQPYGIKVVLEDPLQELIDLLIATGKNVNAMADSVGGKATQTLRLFGEILGITIIEFKTQIPGPDYKPKWFPGDSLSQVLWKFAKWVAVNAWDLKNGRYSLGRGSLEWRLDIIADLTIDPGECPDPAGQAAVEASLRHLATQLDASISNLKRNLIDPIVSPPAPLVWVLRWWGQGEGRVEGRAQAEGLTLHLMGSIRFNLDLRFGLAVPLNGIDGMILPHIADTYKIMATGNAWGEILLFLEAVDDWKVSQKNCQPSPPDLRPPDDRQDIWQGVEGFYEGTSLEATIDNLSGLVQQAQAQGLWRAERFLALRLRNAEVQRFNSDTGRLAQHIQDVNDILVADALDVQGILSGTIPISPSLTITEALGARMEQTTAEIEALPYGRQQSALLDGIAVAERLYAELEGEELELQHELRQLFTQGSVGVVASGFAEATLSVLEAIDLPAILVSPWAGGSDFRGQAAAYYAPGVAPRVLVVPSGGLHAIAASPEARDWLDAYVQGGGLLIVFSQAFGDDWRALPGGEVAGVGYEEDARWQSASVEMGMSSKWLAWMGVVEPDIQVDGLFTAWPADAHPLLRYTHSRHAGAPVMIEYPYGQGTVLATTAYGDWAWQSAYWWGDDARMTHTLLERAYLLVQGKDIEDAFAGQSEKTIDISFPLTNTSVTTATEVQIGSAIWGGGWGKDYITSVPVFLPPGESQVVHATLQLPPLRRDAFHNWTRAGLYHPPITVKGAGEELYSVPGPFVYVRSPVAPALFHVTIRAQPAAAFETAAITVTVKNSLNSDQSLLLHGIFGLPSQVVPLIVPAHASVSHVYTLVADASKRVGVELTDTSGQSLGKASTQLTIHLPRLQASPVLPPVSEEGAVVGLRVLNQAQDLEISTPALNASFTMTLTSPSGTVVWSATQALPPLAAGETITPTFTLDLPVTELGDYRLSYRVNDGTGQGPVQQVLLPARPLVSLSFDRTGYRIREPMTMTVHVANDGLFDLEPWLDLSAPALGWSKSSRLDLPSGEEWSGTYTFTLPATLQAGSYEVTALVRNGGGEHTASFSVLPAKVITQLSQQVYASGETISVALYNTGGVDALVSSYQLWLLGKGGRFLIGEETEALDIPAGQSVDVLGTLPAGMVSGPYTLQINGQYGPGNQWLGANHELSVMGTAIELTARTDRSEYLSSDPIQVTAWLANTGLALPESSLNLSIRKPRASAQAFERYYSWDTGLAYYWMAAVGTDVAGNIWFAGASANHEQPDPDAQRLSADRSTWQDFDIPLPGGKVNVNQIVGSSDGRVWFATDAGVAVLSADATTWTTYHTGNSALLSNRVFAVASEADGDAWFGTDQGISHRAADGQWTAYTTSNSSLLSNWIYAIAQDGNGDTWFGTQRGLTRLTAAGVWHTYTPQNSFLLHDSVYDIAIDPAGDVWLVNTYPYNQGPEGGISVLHPDGTWTTYTPANSGLADVRIGSIAIDRQGRKWFGYTGTCSGPMMMALDARLSTDYTDCGVGMLSADNTTWEQYLPPTDVIAAETMDLAAAPNGDVWIAGLREGVTRAYFFEGEGQILWERTVTANLPSAGTFQDISSLQAASLGESSFLVELHAVLTSPTGQVLAQDVYPFYVFRTPIGLTLETDRRVYSPGDTVYISGQLKNASAEWVTEQWVRVNLNGNEIYAAGPLEVAPGESYPYALTATMPSTEQDVVLEAMAGEIVIQRIISPAPPTQGEASFLVPPLAGTAPFSATLILTNTATVPATLEVSLEGIEAPRQVTLDPGEVRLVAWPVTLAADASMHVTVRGDWTFDLSAAVAWGEGAEIELRAPEGEAAGPVAVPYRLTGTGALLTPVRLEYALDDGAPSIVEAILSPGQVRTGNLVLDVPPGEHILTARLVAANGNLLASDTLVLTRIQAAVPAEPALRLVETRLTPSPVAAGSHLTLSLQIANAGASGPALVGLQLFDLEQQWAIRPSAWSTQTFTFGVEVPADLPADHYVGTLTLEGQRIPVDLDVTGTDIEISLALDQMEYFPNEAGQLTVSLTDLAGVSGDYIVMTRYLDDEGYFTVTVPANQTVHTTFAFTATESSRATVFLSNVPGAEGQRVLMLDSLPVQVLQPERGAYLSFDKLAYNAGDTLSITTVITGEIGNLAVMGPMELSLLDEGFLMWSAPRQQEGLGLIVTDTYHLSYQLPAQLREGRYTFLLQIDGQMYPTSVDVRGWKVNSGHMTLDQVRYAQQDNLSATVEFWNEGNEPITGLRLSAWIFTPAGEVLEFSPPILQGVTLQPGLNVFSISGAFATPEVGPHRLLVNLALPGSAWRLAGAAAQFDVGWSHLVAVTTDQGTYLPGEEGQGRLDVYGFGPTQVVITATGGTALLDQSVDLFGFEAFTFTLPTTLGGDYLLVATSVDRAGGTDRLIRAYDVAEPRDAVPPEIQLIYPSTLTWITTSALSETIQVTGQAGDNAGTVRVFVNGQEALLDGSGAFTVPVDVFQGINLVSAVAVDEEGNETFTDLVPVTLIPARHTTLGLSASEGEVGQTLSYAVVLTASLTISDVTIMGRFTGSEISGLGISANGGKAASDGTHFTWTGDVVANEPLSLEIQVTLEEAGILTHTLTTLWGDGAIETHSQALTVTSITPTATATATRTASATATATATATRTVTHTVTRTPTRTVTRTATRTATRVVTRTATRTPTRTATPTSGPGTCQLMPMALSGITLNGMQVGDVFSVDGYNSTTTGGFGWMTWTGNQSMDTLALSLTPPGNSNTYINPNNANDHLVSVGDWVGGFPVASNLTSIRQALDALKSQVVTFPVWDMAMGQDASLRYRVAGFAKIRLTGYSLSSPNHISGTFLGYTTCQP